MLVRNWMSRNVITVDEEDSMQRAHKLMKEHNIGFLPVMRQGSLVGVVTDRDLKRASPSDATSLEVHELLYLVSKIKVKEIMSKPPITVPDDATVDEVAQVMLSNNIGGVPVLNKRGEVVGVVTQHDIFKVIMSLTGVDRKGFHFGFQLEDSPGSIKVVTDVIRKYGGRLISILGQYEHAPVGRRNVYIRAFNLDREKLPALVAELREKAPLLFFIDVEGGVREIYET